MTDVTGNGPTKYITWFHFVSIVIGVLSVPIIVGWLLFTTYEERTREHLRIIREDIREMDRGLKEDIRGIRRDVNNLRRTDDN